MPQSTHTFCAAVDELNSKDGCSQNGVGQADRFKDIQVNLTWKSSKHYPNPFDRPEWPKL
jgi:hypothetical protein